jgi:hypothetical protein
LYFLGVRHVQNGCWFGYNQMTFSR